MLLQQRLLCKWPLQKQSYTDSHQIPPAVMCYCSMQQCVVAHSQCEVQVWYLSLIKNLNASAWHCTKDAWAHLAAGDKRVNSCCAVRKHSAFLRSYQKKCIFVCCLFLRPWDLLPKGDLPQALPWSSLGLLQIFLYLAWKFIIAYGARVG